MKVYTVYNDNVFWTIHQLIRETLIYLKEEFGAEIHLQKGGHLYISELDYHIPDCEIVIYDEEKDILKAISYSETKTELLEKFKQRNNPDDIFVVLHKLNWHPHLHNIESYHFKFHTTTFYPFSPQTNYEFFYYKRKILSYTEMSEKLFFRATYGRGDQQRLAELGITNDLFRIRRMEEYLELAVGHRVGLSIAGAAELCHREFDLMAVGVPVLRLEYVDTYDPPLIPNYHYISVDREDLPRDPNLDNIGGQKYIDAYVKRYEEVKNDFEFLDFISKNAYDYYDKYCSPKNKINLIKDKLQIWNTTK
jgi:hypothetical protein